MKKKFTAKDGVIYPKAFNQARLDKKRNPKNTSDNNISIANLNNYQAKKNIDQALKKPKSSMPTAILKQRSDIEALKTKVLDIVEQIRARFLLGEIFILDKNPKNLVEYAGQVRERHGAHTYTSTTRMRIRNVLTGKISVLDQADLLDLASDFLKKSPQK